MRVLVAIIHLLVFIVQVECQHKSFVETTFDLDPSLPVEDVAIDVAPPKPEEPPAPTEAVTTPAPPITIPSTPSVTVATLAPIALALPALPSTVGVAPLSPSEAATIAAPLGPSVPAVFGQPTILQNKLQRFRTRPVNRQPKRWFRRNFDLSGCPKNEGFIGQQFKKKFPALLSRGGTDEELAGLVTTRLVACRRKKTANHWQLTQDMLDKNELAVKEELSPSQMLTCRNGLLEEEVACQNLDSYLCQFISPTFSFKMVPVRQIVIEARLTESGANKCRPIVDLLSKKTPVSSDN